MAISLHCDSELKPQLRKGMTLQDLFQILKWQYGSIKEIAQTVEVSSETVKNVLIGGLDSQYKEQVLQVATKKGKAILRHLKENAEREIEEATEKRDKMVTLLAELSEGVESAPIPATA